MLSLLDLPREIREQIIGYVVVHEDERPTAVVHQDDSSSSQTERYRRADLDDGFSFYSHIQHYGIKWPATQAQWNLNTDPRALLQTNKTLREETMYITSQYSGRAQPELDILIINEDELWPTWTFIPPCRDNRPKNILVTIRMSGIAKDKPSGFQEDSGLITLWRFSSILERIMRCSWRPAEDGDVDNFIQLETLTLNFLTPDTADGPLLPDSVAPHLAQHERQIVPNAQIHPYALLTSLSNWVAVMLQYRSSNLPFMNDPHDLLNIVHRIDTMKFQVDGVLRHTEIIHMPARTTT